VQGEAHAAEQGLHRYGALLSQLPPTVRGTSPYRTRRVLRLLLLLSGCRADRPLSDAVLDA